jgi:hypothetical protein
MAKLHTALAEVAATALNSDGRVDGGCRSQIQQSNPSYMSHRLCGIVVYRTGLRSTSFHRIEAAAVFYPRRASRRSRDLYILVAATTELVGQSAPAAFQTGHAGLIPVICSIAIRPRIVPTGFRFGAGDWPSMHSDAQGYQSGSAGPASINDACPRSGVPQKSGVRSCSVRSSYLAEAGGAIPSAREVGRLLSIGQDRARRLVAQLNADSGRQIVPKDPCEAYPPLPVARLSPGRIGYGAGERPMT